MDNWLFAGRTGTRYREAEQSALAALLPYLSSVFSPTLIAGLKVILTSVRRTVFQGFVTAGKLVVYTNELDSGEIGLDLIQSFLDFLSDNLQSNPH